MSMTQGGTSWVAPSGTATSRPVSVAPGAGAVGARGAARGSDGSAKPAANPLRRMMSAGKMPVLLEMHLTEADRVGYERLRRHYLTRGGELPRLIMLGQFVRELDASSPEVSAEARGLVVKLQAYADLVAGGRVDLMALDDGARGRDSLDNAIAAELLIGLGVDPARLMANVVARNRMPDQIRNRLIHFSDLGLRCALLLTGDLPIEKGKPARFPLDSIGMCDLARRMMIEGSLPGDFLIAAAGHPNPDVDPDGVQALHKALAGAQVLVTQAIYSVEMFQSWMEALRRSGVIEMADVLAEMIPVTSSAQLQAVSRVPGMRIPTAFIDELSLIEERINVTARSGGHGEDWIRQQRRRESARVTRSLLHRIRRVPGVSGFYLGCIKSFEPHLELLHETPLLPDQAYGSHRSGKLAGPERQRVLAMRPAIDALVDGIVGAHRRRRNGIVRRRLSGAGQDGLLARTLRVIEWPKVPIFGCKHCDRCDLSADALVCPRGCAKEMTHGPCGAPRSANGTVLCEDTSRACTWAEIRSRRDELGIEMAARLAVRPAPSPGFYRGASYSSFLPVLAGSHPGPDWGLLYRAPWAAVMRMVRGAGTASESRGAIDLVTLVASKAHDMERMIEAEPDADRETILVKVLGLIGTPEARHLIETRLCELGLPAEGTLGELSIRELYRLAEMLPELRRGSLSGGATSQSYAREVALRALPRGAALLRSMRRELAGGLIRHISALGVPVTYAEVLLEHGNVDDFLSALTIFKHELQLFRGQSGEGSVGLAAHFDRVHYKHHYRAPVSILMEPGGDRSRTGRARLLIDVRQFASAHEFQRVLREALQHIADGKSESDGELVLEPFCRESESVCWAFNAAFWRRLKDFEAATGIDYDASIGGSTDHNLAYVRSTARALHDRLHDRAPSEDVLYVLEIGVASVHRAKSFLDELKRLSELTGSGYYDRIVYLLADYAQAILDRGRRELAGHHARVESVLIDAADPAAALRPYAGRIVHAHLCNVYDNLPTDRVMFADGVLSCVEVRAYVPRRRVEEIGARFKLTADELVRMEALLLDIVRDRDNGVAALLDWLDERCQSRGDAPCSYVLIWLDLVAAMRFEKRLRRVDSEAELPALEALGLEHPLDSVIRLLRPLGAVQVHLSQEAIRGFRSLLGMLHPAGALEVVDLFVQRTEEYLDRHKGPAKYDGSTVNWLNGPLFRLVAEAHGFGVRFLSFKPFDPKSVSVTMLAYPETQHKHVS